MENKNVGGHFSGIFLLPNLCCRNHDDVNVMVLPYYSI